MQSGNDFYSKSTKKYISEVRKGFHPHYVIAIGGGSIIDKAKIYAKQMDTICIAIPTTGAGASETSHAVKWGKNKKVNIKTDIPETIFPDFEIKLSKKARRNSIYDILGHIVDYLNVCTDNELVEVGIFAGRLIEKHPTNLTHPRSYPLTLKKKIPHGEAVGMVLIDCIKEAFYDEKKHKIYCCVCKKDISDGGFFIPLYSHYCKKCLKERYK